MRKLFIGIIIVVALAIVFLRGDSFFELVETMQTGLALPLVIAIISQLGKYFAQSFALSNSFRTVGERITPKHTITLIFGQFFMNTVAPSLGTSGIMLIADDAHQFGIPMGRATSAAILMQMSIESGFGFIMIIGFTILGVTGTLDPLWFFFGLFVVVLVGFMASILVLGRRNPALLVRILSPIERLANRFLVKIKKKPMDPWAAKLVDELGEAAGRIAHNPSKAVFVFLFSFIASSCELTCFILCGIAFGVDYLPALIGGYVIATLLAMISFTPQGVGFVEVGVLALMTAYGIDTAAGTAVALTYRGLVFWMPFIIGAVLINLTKSFKKGHVEKVTHTKAGTVPDSSTPEVTLVADDEQPVDAAPAAETDTAKPADTGMATDDSHCPCIPDDVPEASSAHPDEYHENGFRVVVGGRGDLSR